jgi:hypothetical protein
LIEDDKSWALELHHSSGTPVNHQPAKTFTRTAGTKAIFWQVENQVFLDGVKKLAGMLEIRRSKRPDRNESYVKQSPIFPIFYYKNYVTIILDVFSY